MHSTSSDGLGLSTRTVGHTSYVYGLLPQSPEIGNDVAEGRLLSTLVQGG